MQPSDFPALYQSADGSAQDAQRNYLWMIRTQYLLIALAAAVSVGFGSSPDLYIIYVAILSASTALLLFTALQKPEKEWYGCRALAESIKTSTWRYMMRAEPFQDTPNLSDVAGRFSEFLKVILDANSHIRDSISRRPAPGDQITIEMNNTRSLSLSDRIEKYRIERIKEQRSWYIAKAQWNRRHFRIWIIACVAVHALAIILATARIRHDNLLHFWPTEPLLVIASSIVGWIQLKKFNELASAYSLTAHEIGILQTRLGAIDTEESFSNFVNEAERAFSREHTQWVARQIDETP